MTMILLLQEGLVEIREEYEEENSSETVSQSGTFLLLFLSFSYQWHGIETLEST